ncbi:hypothetical protein SAMN05421505_10140 [Sinosporangium album]|uniref:Uncharacterized protein n=1 Tax=Sinosporangium album TaxID=504805 RepID=A0A1G7QLV8_9ACTN|nr:hypothetical protein SAMN05421505_10140 [Sinosporangium album]
MAEAGSGPIDRLRVDVSWAADASAGAAETWIALLEELGFITLDRAARTWSALPLSLAVLPGAVHAMLLTGGPSRPRVLSGGPLPRTEAASARERASLVGIAALYGGSFLMPGEGVIGVRRQGRPFAVVARHPLEACEEGLVSPRLRGVLDAALAHAGDPSRVIVTDWFTAERSPLLIVQQIAPSRGRGAGRRTVSRK